MPHVELVALEVNVEPAQPERLTLAQSEANRDGQQPLKVVATCRVQERPGLPL